MLYNTAILRLVNGVVEKTRRKNEVSIGVVADAIGIPRMLIDIRHEGSHRNLPSLPLLRVASVKALIEKLETNEAMDFQLDGTQSSKNASISHCVELLSCLFEWIIGHLKTQQKNFSEIKVLKTPNHLSKVAILSLLRRCLMVSSSNKHLLSSAVTLAQMTGDNTMLHKVEKLSLLNLENSEIESCDVSLLSVQEY